MSVCIDRRFRIARVWSNDELRKFSPHIAGSVVNASAGSDEDKQGSHYCDYFTAADKYELTNWYAGRFRGYSGRINEHLLDLEDDLPDHLVGAFDAAFNHTTLEHIFKVQTAFANLCRMSRDLVIIVVPFAQVLHETEGYKDYWRFTPGCLRRMYQENGLKVVYESATPYTNSSIYLFFVGSRFPERWSKMIPPHTRITEAGVWIGASESYLCRLQRYFKNFFNQRH